MHILYICRCVYDLLGLAGEALEESRVHGIRAVTGGAQPHIHLQCSEGIMNLIIGSSRWYR
jgi:hypothetical protein